MVQKISISLREHAWERIAKSKPRGMGFSEWIETCAMRGLETPRVASGRDEMSPPLCERAGVPSWLYGLGNASGTNSFHRNIAV